MKKLICSVAILSTLFGFSSQAKTIFSCEGTFKGLAPGETLHLKLKQSSTKEFEMEKDGVVAQAGPNESISYFEPELDGLAEFLKCGDYDENCKDKASKGKDPGFKDFAGTIKMAKVLDMMKETKGSSTLANLNIADIKSGKSYVFTIKDKPSKLGNMGVYEYYGSSNKLLGRYIYALEVLDCKDKDQPSKSTSNSATKSGPAQHSGRAGTSK